MPATAASADNPIVASCSFCDKPNTAVKSLVAGPGVFICNECVELSAAIVADALGMSTDTARQRFEAERPV